MAFYFFLTSNQLMSQNAKCLIFFPKKIASQKGVVASRSSCGKDVPAAAFPSLKSSPRASQRRVEYLESRNGPGEVGKTPIEPLEPGRR